MIPDLSHLVDATKALPDGGSWVRLSDVAPERVSWLQPSRLALGKLTLWDGDPGLGKGFALASLLAAVSTGSELPGRGEFGPADVILLSSEDGLADTIRPRLDAAGGDPSRIHVLSFVRRKGEKFFPSLKRDMDVIERKVGETGAKLLGIDPFMGFLGVKDSHKDADVKEALGPFAQMLDRLKLAAIGIRHLNKSQVASSLYRGGGSIGIIGSARSAFLFAADPDDENRRIVAATKANLCPMPPSLAFTIRGTPNGSARAIWEPRTNEHRADALLQSVVDGRGAKRVGQEAAEWLSGALKDGSRVVDELKDEAVNGHGFSWKTVERAKEKLGVAARKKAGVKHGGWTWQMAAAGGPRTSPPGLENLGALTALRETRETRETRQSTYCVGKLTVLSAETQALPSTNGERTRVTDDPQQVSTNNDGPCVAVADVSDRVTGAKPEAVSGASPGCWRCMERDAGRRMGARGSTPCDVCGTARPLISAGPATVEGATPPLALGAS